MRHFACCVSDFERFERCNAHLHAAFAIGLAFDGRKLFVSEHETNAARICFGTKAARRSTARVLVLRRHVCKYLLARLFECVKYRLL